MSDNELAATIAERDALADDEQAAHEDAERLRTVIEEAIRSFEDSAAFWGRQKGIPTASTRSATWASAAIDLRLRLALAARVGSWRDPENIAASVAYTDEVAAE